MERNSLTLVVHGRAGSGKSWLADTMPSPRVIIDVEGGLRFTPSRKVVWDPKYPIPDGAGTEWDTAIVSITGKEYHEPIMNVYGWLNEREHPFRSFAIDSMSELAERIISGLAGPKLPGIQDYGNLYWKLNPLAKAFRDLTREGPKNPLEVVLFVCGSEEKGKEQGVMRPAIVGKTAGAIGYMVDAMGYLSVSINQQNEVKRMLTFIPLPGIDAKDRTGRLGAYMEDPTVPKIIDTVYGPKEAA